LSVPWWRVPIGPENEIRLSGLGGRDATRPAMM
jgi:hypothetical protein